MFRKSCVSGLRVESRMAERARERERGGEGERREVCSRSIRPTERGYGGPR